jgi:dipeptidyl aminopeptidase/acylaminoacyl peptidase
MTMRSRVLAAVTSAFLFAAAYASELRRPIVIDDLLRIPRVADVQVSPDGKHLTYTVATPNAETNETETNLWVADIARTASRQLTYSGKDRSARWSPDGKRLAFLSRRDGKSQVYLLSIDGGEARAITHMASDVETMKWSPDGVTLVISTVVDPDCTNEECIKASAAKRATDKGARIYDRWPVWNAMRWMDNARSHLFAIKTDGSAPPKDLTPGKLFDVPSRLSIDLSVDHNDIAISPDGKEVCFSAGTVREADGQSFSHLFRVPLAGGEPKQITSGSSNEVGPVYSPDGRFIAYRSQRNGKDSGEQSRLMMYRTDSGEVSDATAGFDRSVASVSWAPNGKAVYFIAEDSLQAPLFELSTSAGASPRKVIDGFVGELSVSRSGKAIAFTRSSLAAPSEIFVAARAQAAPRQITRHAEPALSAIQLASPDSFWFKSKDSTSVQALFIPPPGLQAGHKYPLLVLLHGGPHTMWGDSWSYRWNAQVFAAPGYGVLMVNRRGSTGYGQKFSDGVVHAWGGAPYEDIMSGIDAALARYDYLDGARIAAAGASYGGYMANWLATHTGRFKAIVSHAGVFNLSSMYAMDLQWFLEFEQNGTPWGAPQQYAQWSPATYAAELGKFKTPMLVTTGERDYRVPFTQSLELFAALQRQGVPSKLVVVPEEGHWILKPQNSRQWYTTFLDWLARYLQ